MSIEKQCKTYIDFKSPHAAVVNCWWAILREHFFVRVNCNLVELDGRIGDFFNATESERFIEFRTQYAESYRIYSYWKLGMLYPDIDIVNGIGEFEANSKCLAYIDSYDWNFFDDTSEYLYPAVFYSWGEVKGWFALIMLRHISFVPAHQDFFRNILHKCVDVDLSLALLYEKLIGLSEWDFGPARLKEPGSEMWREQAKNPKNNELILTWFPSGVAHGKAF